MLAWKPLRAMLNRNTTANYIKAPNKRLLWRLMDLNSTSREKNYFIGSNRNLQRTNIFCQPHVSLILHMVSLRFLRVYFKMSINRLLKLLINKKPWVRTHFVQSMLSQLISFFFCLFKHISFSY